MINIKDTLEKHNSIKDIYSQLFSNEIKNTIYDSVVFDDSIDEIIYENCTFTNVKFYDLKLKNILFLNCTFKNSEFKDITNTIDAKYMFEGCLFLFTTFTSVSFLDVMFIECDFNMIKFEKVRFYYSQFIKSSFHRVEFIGPSDIANISIISPKDWLDIKFNYSEGMIKVNKQAKIDKFNIKNVELKSRVEYDFENAFYRVFKVVDIADTYLGFAELFRISNLFDEYSDYYFMGKRLKHKNLSFFKKIKSLFELITCGYGEKWHYGLLLSIFVIVGSAIIYMFNGIVLNGETIINYNLNILNPLLNWNVIYDFGYSLYFSMMTFTAVGYGNISANSETSHIVSFFEMYLGVILIAIITGTILRKLFR